MAGAWEQPVRVGLRVALVLALVYLGAAYYSRWTSVPLQRDEPERIERVEDFYVHPPKSYVTDLDSARKLLGKPLWVKEGYRWRTQGGRLLEPIEQIIPTGFTGVGGEARLQFEREGRVESVAIGSPSHVYIDEMFFIKDPRDLYTHWSEETWRMVESHQIELGMTEFQVGFALGAGATLRSSPTGAERVVEYRLCEEGGLKPVRITFRDGRATEIVELAERDEAN